jgi:NAD(P)-dependent dehydrogenase (short-subunit alcohol dehydrogenase family)
VTHLTVLITGASSGLGRATAKYFHAHGWNVVATMRDPDQESELTQLSGVLVTRLDVQDEESIQHAVALGLQRFGRIDALVNNAGYGAYGPLEATSMAKVRRQFDVNVLGLLATIKAVLPHFRAQRSGTIVNISSVGGRLAFPLGTLYHGSKFAVEGVSESLHYELAPLGVRVKVVAPGGMKTDFGTRSLDFSNDPVIEVYQPLVQTTLGVLGPMLAQGAEPEDAAAVVYAAVGDASPRLHYVAGTDAAQMLAQRNHVGEEAFMAGMRTQFGIHG